MSKPLILLVIVLIAGGCRFFKGDPFKNTTISGATSIAVDETFRPVMEAEVDLFKAVYGYSDIRTRYVPENKAIELLMKDSVQLIVISRKLTEAEILQLNNRKLFPKQLKVATDAVALITHPSCKDSVISMKQIQEILGGKLSDWNQLDTNSPSSPIKILFDNERSGIVRLMADSVCHGNFSAKNVSALEFNKEVIEYTATHRGVLGFIGAGWIANKNDSLHLSFHHKIRVLSVSESERPNAENSYKPYQAYLLDHLYPLSRPVYIINAEPRNGLATGFASFVASDKGQRIILKSGIVPTVAPVRVVNVRPNL
jgi:phosphate transport system substrate-binding protein